MDRWLGRERSLSPITRPVADKRLVLGVLGTRSNIRIDDLEAQILTPLLEIWGAPEEIILPSDGDSSYAIQSWAEFKGIPVTLVSCDWAKHGRKAGLLRDSCIQRTASHLLLIQGPRSNALSTMARRLDRKGRPVIISERPGESVKKPSTK
jgi:hypothetical protein